jgi:hypothetical protein
MSTRSRKIMFLGSRARPCAGKATLPPSVSQLSNNMIINISHPYRPLRPVTGIAFTMFECLRYFDTSYIVTCSIPVLAIFFFNLPNPFGNTMSLGRTQPLSGVPGIFFGMGVRARRARKAANLTAICEAIV